jgi:hypothetical protein
MSIKTLVLTQAHNQKCTQQKHNNIISIVEKQKLINTSSNFLRDSNVSPKMEKTSKEMN